MSEKRLFQVSVLVASVGIIGLLIPKYLQRNDPVVRLNDVECAAAQRAYDDGERDTVLFDILRDCDRR